jgi:hypothetical protein
VDDDDEELLMLNGPLEALTQLLVEDDKEIQHMNSGLLDAAKKLSDPEIAAINEFATAGQRCLARLSGDTLLALEAAQAVDRALHRNDQMSVALNGSFAITPRAGDAPAVGPPVEQTKKQTKEQKSVAELFRRFDSDNDGALSEEEFRQAFRKLTGGTLSDAQVDKMVRAADVNRDGFVDIFEFTVWLYSSSEDQQKGVLRRNSSTTTGVGPTTAGVGADAELAKLTDQLNAMKAELKVKNKALGQMEEQHEQEMKITHDFWREIAKHAVLTIDQKVDLKCAAWLGNGKYGFVMKATRREDGKDLVLKMMGIRWAHLAVKEWQHGAMIGKHPNIVEYEDVMIHADGDNVVRDMIKLGYDQGHLKARSGNRRTQFPDRYICLTQEFMNAGSIQDWIDDDHLRPGGMFVVMRQVAAALAFLHGVGVCHNDIKPENVMVNQDRGSASGDGVVVKLGDLGLTAKSTDTSADFWQYGMTVFCMVTGERFGSRKYRPQLSETFASECQQAIEGAQPSGRLRDTLVEVPDILRRVFKKEVAMEELATKACLHGWDFFDEGARCATPGAKGISRSQRKLSTVDVGVFEAKASGRLVVSMSPKGEHQPSSSMPPPGG